MMAMAKPVTEGELLGFLREGRACPINAHGVARPSPQSPPSRRFKTDRKRRSAPGIHAAMRRGWTLSRTGPVLPNNVISSVPGSRPL